MNASAVSDAQRNAEINGIKNCRFVCGKVRIWAHYLLPDLYCLSGIKSAVTD